MSRATPGLARGDLRFTIPRLCSAVRRPVEGQAFDFRFGIEHRASKNKDIFLLLILIVIANNIAAIVEQVSRPATKFGIYLALASNTVLNNIIRDTDKSAAQCR